MIASAVVGGVSGLVIGVLIGGAIHYIFMPSGGPSGGPSGNSNSEKKGPVVNIIGDGNVVNFEETMRQASPEAKREVRDQMKKNLSLLEELL